MEVESWSNILKIGDLLLLWFRHILNKRYDSTYLRIEE